mmetsp:Transcript_82583/g.220776  ORF Transcript_82583/g.220776 Transcript_82583/m.220776 type:complete len:229 (+) Transcript_82583:772-1458(+)
MPDTDTETTLSQNLRCSCATAESGGQRDFTLADPSGSPDIFGLSSSHTLDWGVGAGPGKLPPAYNNKRQDWLLPANFMGWCVGPGGRPAPHAGLPPERLWRRKRRGAELARSVKTESNIQDSSAQGSTLSSSSATGARLAAEPRASCSAGWFHTSQSELKAPLHTEAPPGNPVDWLQSHLCDSMPSPQESGTGLAGRLGVRVVAGRGRVIPYKSPSGTSNSRRAATSK